MKKIQLLFTLAFLLLANDPMCLHAQSRFRDAADSLDWWNARRFNLSGLRPYTRREIDSMKQESLRKQSPLTPVPPDTTFSVENTTGSQVEEARFKNVRTGNQSRFEPMIAVSPVNGDYFFTAYEGDLWTSCPQDSIPDGPLRALGSFTTNGGATWVASDIPTSWLKYAAQGDPVIAYDADGNLYYAYLDFNSASSHENAIIVGQSIDNGAHWSNQYIVADNDTPRTTTDNDKEWLACDVSNSQYRNSLYVCWTLFSNNEANKQILFSYKRPTVGNFTTPVPISSQVSSPFLVQGSQVVVGNDGKVYVFWLKREGVADKDSTLTGSFWMNVSMDGGKTFSGERQLTDLGTVVDAELRVVGGFFQRSNSFPSVAVRQTGAGNYELCLAWCDLRNGRPQVLFSKSTDNGAHWNFPTPVTLGGMEQFLPSITVNSRGIINVAYFDLVDRYGSIIQLSVAESKDGGASFTNTATQNGSSSALGFIGDYIGIASNNYTYWGVYPALRGDCTTIPYHNDILGTYRAVSAIVENDLPQVSNDSIQYDGRWHRSSYPTPYLIAGTLKVIKASNPKQAGGETYSFS
ncbi:MAG: exo-alpha-sialidase [Ignavibacteria bacterium]|nr:exo-alpha-sialidase [Ignavibacteria bacterium]